MLSSSLPTGATDRATLALADFLDQHHRVFVLTGAGCSTASGIPEYRDDIGNWKHRQPMTLQRFLSAEAMRRRYWAGSTAGYRRIHDAQPNPAHRALAALERGCWIRWLVTQNVDCLHRRAGSRAVVELHGRLDEVACLACGHRVPRERFQAALEAANPGFGSTGVWAPDGDVRVSPEEAASFVVPACAECEGIIKPNVVFFGESVPPATVETTLRQLHASDAVLVVGSSLMVYSGFRFVRAAAERGLPVAIINRGKTRADGLATLKLVQPCEQLLAGVQALLGG